LEWIKLWTKETIFGTTSKEIPYEMRGIWFQLLCLAGIEPCFGQVCISKDLAYTDNQLAKILDTPIDTLKKGLKILIDVEKIEINGDGIIGIINWSHYQSQAGYMKSYRERNKNKFQDASAGLKIKVMKKYNFTCQKCKWKPGKLDDIDILRVHHKIPQSQGGSNELKNLIVLCKDCHNLIHKDLKKIM